MNSSFVIDTNAYSAFKRGHKPAVEIIKKADNIIFSPIVLAELKAGFGLGKLVSKLIPSQITKKFGTYFPKNDPIVILGAELGGNIAGAISEKIALRSFDSRGFEAQEIDVVKIILGAGYDPESKILKARVTSILTNGDTINTINDLDLSELSERQRQEVVQNYIRLVESQN